MTDRSALSLPAELHGLPRALAPWLSRQRWFAGKDRPIDTVELLEASLLQEAPRAWHVVVAVAQGQDRHAYQVPVSLREDRPDRMAHAVIGVLEVPGDDGPRELAVYDALHDKAVTGPLLELFEAGATVGSLVFHREEGAVVPIGEAALVLTGEQSNTSLAYGDAALLKVFRRLTGGTNPDVEVHDALTRAGCPYVAPLLGWLDGRWRDPQHPDEVEASGSLAMLQTFLTTATDGWQLALASVRDLFAEADLHADEVGGDFAAESHRLGVATAEVHQVMRASLPTGALGPAELQALAQAMRRRLELAVEVVPALAGHAESLRAAYDAVAALPGPVAVQRVHGDYHLGQVMRTVSGWKLLDFEGEPAKPLAERVRLDSPVRDVAGMLRSYDYAARQLLVTDHPGDRQLAYRAEEWAQRNRTAFCDGYAEAAADDPRDAAVLLRAYETDKAVYETVYEARNRPTWLVVPMAAIERLAAGPHLDPADGGSRP